MNAYLFNERLANLFEERICRLKERCTVRENIELLMVSFNVLPRTVQDRLVSLK